MTREFISPSNLTSSTTPEPKHFSLKEVVHHELARYFGEHGCRPSAEVSLYKRMTNQVEEALIVTTLNYTDGNETRASQILGISRATLRQRRVLLGHYKNKAVLTDRLNC